MAEARDFHCYSHVLENLGKDPFRVIMRLYVWLFKKTDYLGTPGQMHSELDVQTSRFLFFF